MSRGVSSAFVIRRNDEKRTSIEPFHGQPKWPEARKPRTLNTIGLPELSYGKLARCEIKEFPHGGVLFIRQKSDDDNSIAAADNLYFDGVSFDELAQYFEESRRFPVVNQTKDKLLYSFTLPGDVEKQFSFGKTVPLPGLGLSVTSDEAEMEAMVVRDKHAKKAENRFPGQFEEGQVLNNPVIWVVRVWRARGATVVVPNGPMRPGWQRCRTPLPRLMRT